jgi:hypothetical protein
MRTSLKRAGAAALAAATVVSGLSFGSAAASAAPEHKAESAKAGAQALAPVQLIFKVGSSAYYSPAAKQRHTDTSSNFYRWFTSENAALLDAPRFTPRATADGWFQFLDGNSKCITMSKDNIYWDRAGMIVGQSCSADSSKFRVEGGKLRAYDSGFIGELRLLASGSTIQGYALTATSTGWGMAGDLSPITPPKADNGGFTSAGVGFDATIPATERRIVHFGASANATITSMTNTTITVNAPSGSTFASGQTTLTGAYKPSGGTWSDSSSLTMTGTVNAAGTQFTGRMATPGSSFALHDGHQIRWGIDVVAGETAGTQNMAFSGAGTTNHGAFSFAGNSAVTVEAATTDLTAIVDRVDNAKREATLTGTATPGSLIKVNGETIATTAPLGNWVGTVEGLNPGSNTITVEQWNGQTKVDQVDVVVTIVDILEDGHGPDTVLTRGGATEVFGHVGIAESFHSVNSGKVVFTAPAGTTFAADQDTITGSYRSAGGSWTETQRLRLANGTLSEDGTKYTFTWSSDSGITFPKDGDIRWGIKVNTPAKGTAIDDTLDYAVTGDSNKGTFAANGSTKTTAPAPAENGGFLAAGVGDSATIEQGTSENVSLGMKADAATTLDGITEVTVTAPAGTTFASNLTKLSGSYKTASGSWTTTPALDVTGTVSPDGRTFTGTIAAADTAFAAGSEARWTGKLAAATDASIGTRDLGFTVAGSTNLGSFSVAGTSAITITKAEVAPVEDLVVTTPANGSTVDTKRPVFSGTGDEGATIEIKGTTRVVATTTVVDGKWSVPSNIDLGDGTYALTATQTATSGDVQTKPISFTIKDTSGYVDLTAKGAFDADVTKPATISGAATTGGIVIVKDSLGNEIGRATAADGKYSIAIPPTAAHFGVNDFTVTQTVKGDVSKPVTVSLDYGTPKSINITSPTNGATVGKDGLTFTGTGENGARVDIRGSVRAIATGTVADGTWSAPVTVDLSSNIYNLWAVQTTKGGLTSNQAITVTIVDQTVAPLTATAAFNAQDENLPATISGNAQLDATVTVKNAAGKVIGTATATGGKYSIAIDPKEATFGINTFTITQTAFGKESDPLTRTLDYGNPVAPVISTPANGATVDSGKVTFTGTGSSGANVEMRGMVSAVGTGKVVNGTWTVETRELSANVYRLFAVQTTKGGLTQQVETMVTLEDKKTTELTAAGTFGAEVDVDATISGDAQTGASVVVKEGNTVVKTVTAADSKYSVAIPATTSGVRTFTVTQTVDGVVSAAKTVTLDYGTVTGVEVTSPSNGDVISDATVTFTGTGTPGAKVKVSGTTSQLGTATVNAAGEWSVTLTRQLTPQDYTLFVKQTTKGNLVGDAVERTFTVIK